MAKIVTKTPSRKRVLDTSVSLGTSIVIYRSTYGVFFRQRTSKLPRGPLLVRSRRSNSINFLGRCENRIQFHCPRHSLMLKSTKPRSDTERIEMTVFGVIPIHCVYVFWSKIPRMTIMVMKIKMHPTCDARVVIYSPRARRLCIVLSDAYEGNLATMLKYPR